MREEVIVHVKEEIHSEDEEEIDPRWEREKRETFHLFHWC